jgi:hypothetical protein
MEEDGEKEKIKFIEDLKKQGVQVLGLQKEIRSLKTRIGKLTGRVEEQENLELQKQIFSLSDELKSLNNSVLKFKRLMAMNDMNLTQYLICEAIKNKYTGQTKAKLKEFIRIKYSRSSEATKTSNEPLSIMLKFRHECVEFSDEHNLEAFIG